MGGTKLGRALLRLRVRMGPVTRFARPVTVTDRIYPTPILIVRGDRDSLVSLGEAEALYEKAKEPKELAIFKGMEHPPKLPEEFYRNVES